MSGAHAFNFYAVSIFRASFTGIDPHGAAALVAFVQLLASITSGLLVDTISRLPLLIASNLFITLLALSSTWKAAPWPIQRPNRPNSRSGQPARLDSAPLRILLLTNSRRIRNTRSPPFSLLPLSYGRCRPSRRNYRLTLAGPSIEKPLTEERSRN